MFEVDVKKCNGEKGGSPVWTFLLDGMLVGRLLTEHTKKFHFTKLNQTQISM